MKKSRYSEEQIAFALKRAETGTPVAKVIRQAGISEQTFYQWKKVHGGLGGDASSSRTPGVGESRHPRRASRGSSLRRRPAAR
ncbi:transposase [Sphingomonas sp.]|uniref:transposase n=1 Tax=Sphingomonas sp. TaxID=28214 RepID=UPI003B0061CA